MAVFCVEAVNPAGAINHSITHLGVGLSGNNSVLLAGLMQMVPVR